MRASEENNVIRFVAESKEQRLFFHNKSSFSIKESYEKVKNFAKNRDYLPSFLYLCESKFY